MKRLLLYLLLGFSTSISAQQMRPPMDHAITFSGNFGEIRSNHYHGGLDFKTGGVEGKVVRSIADGYISRVQVNTSSGYVITVVHDNGYSSVYRHLSRFVEPIASKARQMQYEQQQWVLEWHPEKDEYPVKEGQQIGWSGNTGYSLGPHLHLDVFDNVTDDFVDPLPFFITRIKDNTAPKANGFMLFPQPGQGVVDGSQENLTYPLKPQKPIKAWGVIGVGIKAYDYMEGVSNKYGVKHVLLTVDGEPVFESDMSNFAYEENRYINSWCEGQYMKSFIDPGNRLRLLHDLNGNRGLIDINEERPYQLQYTLTDGFGNTSKVNLIIHGEKQDILPLAYEEKDILHWDQVNIIQQPGLELVIPKGMLYKDEYLDTEVRKNASYVSNIYQLTQDRVKLHGPCEIQIGVTQMPVEDAGKYQIVRVGEKGNSSIGGKLENGFIKARIQELGTFAVEIDTIPPVIKPVNEKMWAKNSKVVLAPTDKQSGITKYSATIDGEWALLGQPNSAKEQLVLKLDPQYVKRGQRHLLVVTVEDGCGNATEEQYRFHW